MYQDLRPEQIDILVGSPAVNDEFSQKIRELDRRLQANGMSYRDWDILNDRQHDIFSNDMFLDGECATSVKDYVMGAVDSCWCPDVVEDLEHHSPVLMREIEKQQDMLPDMKVKIGESLNNLNETIDLLLENIILSERKKSLVGDKIVSANPVSLRDAKRLAAKVKNPKDVKARGVPYEWSIIARARMAGLGLIPLSSDSMPDLSDRRQLNAIKDMMQEDHGQRMRQVFFDHYPWDAEGEKLNEPTLAYWKSGLWESATKALREMNLDDDEIKKLADIQHTQHSDQAGIPGDPEPKTDIIIGPRRISVKLDGGIQIASGGAKQMMLALKGALAIYKDKYPNRFERLVDGVKEGIELSQQRLMGSMSEDLVNKIGEEWDNIREEYQDPGYYVKEDRLSKFLDRSKIGSTLYNAVINKNATPEDIQKYQKFAKSKEPVLDGETVTDVLSDLYLKIVNESRQARVIEDRFDKGIRSWVQKLFSEDTTFKEIYIREAATGEATFKDTPEAAATHYLSPDSFNSFEGKEGEKVVTAMADSLDFSFVPQSDPSGGRFGALRSKARGKAQSEMVFRLGLTGKQIKERLQAMAEKIWNTQVEAHTARVYPDLTSFDASTGSFEGNRDDDLDEAEDAGRGEEQKAISSIANEVASEISAGFPAVDKAFRAIVDQSEPDPVTDEDAMTVLDNIEDYINFAEI